MIASRCTVVRSNARPVAQRATRPSCRVAVVSARRQRPDPATPSEDSLFRATMAAGFAAAVLLLNNQPATAAPGVMTGKDSPQEKMLGTVDKLDDAVRRQPTGAVTQAIGDTKDKVLDQMQNLKGSVKDQVKGLQPNRATDSPFLEAVDNQAPLLRNKSSTTETPAQPAETPVQGLQLKDLKGQAQDSAKTLQRNLSAEQARSYQEDSPSDQPPLSKPGEQVKKVTGNPLDVLTGKTPTKEVGGKILDGLDKVDDAVRKQPTGAVQQAAQDLKDQLVDEAKDYQKTDKQAAEGLRSNWAQLKSLVGL